MATVNFLYRSTKDTAPLNLRLLFRLNDKDFALGAKTKKEVSKHYWTKEHFQKRPKDVLIENEQLEVNQELNKIKNHILDAFKKENSLPINNEWLSLQIEWYYNPPKKVEVSTNLVEYIDYYIDYRKHELTPRSISRIKVVQNKLEQMQVESRRSILIKDINDNFRNEFVAFQKKNGYAQNTIQRELVFIKTFCKHARFLGLETDPQMDVIRVDKAKAEKIYLTFDELETIGNKVFDSDYLDNARDWLIISCYTGQRVSDFLRFTKKMIRVENGKSLLEFTQKKTDKLVTIPIHKKVLEILDKRNGEFPRSLSDQKYNDYIKEVCKIIGLTEPTQGGKMMDTENGMRKVSGVYPKYELVTSHIGRRSLATNFYGKIPTSYLIYITAHGSEAQFLNYIGKSNKDLALEIGKYF